MKGEDGIPGSNLRERQSDEEASPVIISNYQGLKMAFDLAAQGKSDREVAIGLNASGYRTTGTHGPRPFSKDTVKDILKNRFYVGELSDGNGGWLNAKHEAFIDPSQFEEVGKMREARTRRQRTVRTDAHTYSLSGVARCADCGNTLRSFTGRGRVRLACNGRIKGGACTQTSTFLDVYESQLLHYLQAFSIPSNYQEKILEAHRRLESAYNTTKQLETLRTRLERLRELYEWGHTTRSII